MGAILKLLLTLKRAVLGSIGWSQKIICKESNAIIKISALERVSITYFLTNCKYDYYTIDDKSENTAKQRNRKTRK